jgi:hypothetical protein
MHIDLIAKIDVLRRNASRFLAPSLRVIRLLDMMADERRCDFTNSLCSFPMPAHAFAHRHRGKGEERPAVS